ncbi:CLUL1 protein, partial [Atractosteus spatula]|nr:CLUL1 protein [Atractosteus spatula]
MRWLLVLVMCSTLLGVLQSIPRTNQEGLSKDTLKKLSKDGQKYVDEEMKKALFGVKQMKDIMEMNEEKHEHLMSSLKHSSEKKKGAVQLAKEVEQQLGVAEQHCQASLKSAWEECRPCLEHTCTSFYTSRCRRGFSTFTAKVEEFFSKMSSQFSSHDNQDLLFKQSPETFDTEVAQIENSFHQLLSEVNSLYEKSVMLVTKMQKQFDQALQAAFTSDLRSKELEEKPLSPSQQTPDSGFFEGLGLEDVLESFFDFGRNVFEEFSSVITQAFGDLQESVTEETNKEKEGELSLQVLPSQSRQLCRDLRRQSSECWQFQSRCQSCQKASQECPSVTELHSELNEISYLVNVSSQQYEEVLQILQHHTEDTVGWLTNMAAYFGWVAELANSTVEPESVFTITTVVPHPQDGESNFDSDTTVEVNILNSPTFTLSVPGDLEIQDPDFVKYIAQEALGMYKQLARQDAA